MRFKNCNVFLQVNDDEPAWKPGYPRPWVQTERQLHMMMMLDMYPSAHCSIPFI